MKTCDDNLIIIGIILGNIRFNVIVMYCHFKNMV